MASVGVAPTSGLRESGGGVDRLPEEMNDMKIRDDKVCDPLCQFLNEISFFLFFFLPFFVV